MRLFQIVVRTYTNTRSRPRKYPTVVIHDHLGVIKLSRLSKTLKYRKKKPHETPSPKNLHKPKIGPNSLLLVSFMTQRASRVADNCRKGNSQVHAMEANELRVYFKRS